MPFKYKGANQTETVTNGTFATDSDWTKETGWTITGGKAVAASAGAGSLLYQTPAGSAAALVIGKKYRVKYTVSDYSAGTIKVRLGLSQLLTTRSANGTYIEEVVCTANTVSQLVLQPITTFTGKIDDVSVIQIGAVAEYDGSGMSSGRWYDKSGNNLHGAVTGASLENKATSLGDSGIFGDI